MKDSDLKFVVSALGLGYLPVCPGTWASLGAAAAQALLVTFAPPAVVVPIMVAAIAVSFALGMALTPWAEQHFGKKDPRQFVLDEVAGQWLACLWFVPVGGGEVPPWQYSVIAFFVFRLFDIVKPPPIRRIEKLPAGWGVMLDDVFAGVYAAVVLFVGLCMILPAVRYG